MLLYYQQYHDTKDRIDELKESIISSGGSGSGSGGGISGKKLLELADASISGSGGGGGSSSIGIGDDSGPETDQIPTTTTPHTTTTTPTTTTTTTPTTTTTTTPTTTTTLNQLILEKKNLHAYLKSYEKDFNSKHGRPVQQHEDIQPVAAEYNRYKNLKQLISEEKLKVNSTI